jgi:hypothetical protein
VTNVMILVNIIFVEKMATYTNKPKKNWSGSPKQVCQIFLVIPNVHKIHQMSIKYTNIFPSNTLQKLPEI